MFANRHFCLIACLCANIGFSMSANAADPMSGDAARGRAIVAASCANCHGADGKASGKAYPKLSGQRPEYITEQLMNFKTRSREDLTMTDVSARLAPADIRDVAAYLSAIPAPVERTSAAPAPTPAGERLFSQGNPAAGVPACQSCHGPRGAGLAAAGVPRVAGQPALYVWSELEAFKSAERGTEGGNVMRIVASRLSEKEMQDLARYIAALN